MMRISEIALDLGYTEKYTKKALYEARKRFVNHSIIYNIVDIAQKKLGRELTDDELEPISDFVAEILSGDRDSVRRSVGLLYEKAVL